METPAPTAAAAPPGIEPKPWGVREALMGVGLAIIFFIFIGSVVVGSAMAITGETEGAALVAAGVVAAILFDGVLLFIVYLFAVRKYRLSWESLGFRISLGEWWWVPPLAAFSALLATGLYTFAMRELGVEALAPEQEVEDLFDTMALLPLVGLLTILVAPLTEETFFRGFLFPSLIGRFGVWGAAGITGMLFGAAHITSAATIGLIIPLGAIGIFLAWLYYRTGSLWVSIATHLLFNAVSFTGGVLGS